MSDIMKITFPTLLKVSYSRIKSWRRCQMQHHLRYNEKLRKKKKPLALYLGTAIHTCIELYREGHDWRQHLEEVQKEFNRLFAEERVELGDIPGELKAVMENYFDYYSDDTLVYPARRWGERTEIKVAVYLDSSTLFVGYVDAYPEDEEGRGWIMDHKSFSKMPDEASRYADFQFVVYDWLLPQCGYPKPYGIIWDYLRKQPPVKPEVLRSGALSKAKGQNTTYGVYMAEAIRLFGKKQAMAEYHEFALSTFGDRDDRFFRRVTLPNPSPILVDNVVKDLFTSIEEIRRMGPTSKVRNMTRDCGWCSYFNLCSAEVRGLDTTYMRKVDFETKGTTDDQEENVTSGE